jgi:MurNAc alpha-1-phosphate uridylyltransferase
MSAPVTSAMLLAAGLGQRMRPLTLHTPKPLIKVAGKPIIDYGFAALRAQNITHIVANAHWLPDQIEAWARTQQPQVTVSDERAELLDTGGGVKKALSLLGSNPFFVLNSDSFWTEGAEPALARMSGRFSDEMDCLLLLSTLPASVGYEGRGDFTMDADGRLIRRQGAHVAPFVFAGVYLVRPSLFEGAPEGAFSMNLLWDKALANGRLFGLRHDGRWLHVGTPQAIAPAEAALKEI